MKRILSFVLCLMLLLTALPVSSLAATQMNDDVPVWTEETIRQYALDYISGKDMARLWNYYDLQIRRYMPERAFESFLVDLEFLTGDFVALGSYRCFEEPEVEMKTHVLHLCMENMDLDMYLMHKNKEDDWEIMALEFVPAEKETVVSDPANLLMNSYTETVVTLGTEAYPLEGYLAMPDTATAQTPVPACVFVHDFDASDRDHTIGNTAMFKDIADEFAQMGIASIRYDKRSYTYPEADIPTLWEDVVEDVLSAVAVLKENPLVDQQRIVVFGIGLGAVAAPRIALQSEGNVTALVMIGAKPGSLLDNDFARSSAYLSSLGTEESDNERYIIRNFSSYNDERVREMTLLSRNAYFYREAEDYPQIRTLQKLSIPVFIAQGEFDPVVSENDGRRAYQKQLGSSRSIELETFRGLNHLLMNDLTTDVNGEPQYQVATHVDKFTARSMAEWILALYSPAE